MNTADCRTFDDWMKAGRIVKRGEKSAQRDSHGNAVFTKSQTRDPRDPFANIPECIQESELRLFFQNIDD